MGSWCFDLAFCSHRTICLESCRLISCFGTSMAEGLFCSKQKSADVFFFFFFFKGSSHSDSWYVSKWEVCKPSCLDPLMPHESTTVTTASISSWQSGNSVVFWVWTDTDTLLYECNMLDCYFAMYRFCFRCVGEVPPDIVRVYIKSLWRSKLCLTADLRKRYKLINNHQMMKWEILSSWIVSLKSVG